MREKMSVSVALAVVLALAAVCVSIPPFAATPATAQSSTTINVIGGEINVTLYGFALAGQPLSSPGPAIVVKQGDTVTINFTNVGGNLSLPHTFNIVDSDGQLAFPNANIGTPDNPINAGQSGTMTFTADKAGNFTYLCLVPGHKQLGMWGTFVVQPSG